MKEFAKKIARSVSLFQRFHAECSGWRLPLFVIDQDMTIVVHGYQTQSGVFTFNKSIKYPFDSKSLGRA